MPVEKRHEELVLPEDLDAALRADQQAAAIWDRLPDLPAQASIRPPGR